MKKTISIGLTLVLCISFAGCKINPTTIDQPEDDCNHQYTASVTKEASYESAGVMTYVCSLCNDTYTETIAKLEKPSVPTTVLDSAISKARYQSSMFSISVAELVNSAMDSYEITYLTGEEAVENGYISKENDSVNLDYVYYGIISGEAMSNPNIPHMTTYESEAVKVLMLFDENHQLQESTVSLCDNLETCAIILMTSTY